MKNIFFVGFGGFIGAVLRYKAGGFIFHHTKHMKFPVGTFFINVLGCLLIGLLSGEIEKHHFFRPEVRLLLITGMLGGFTTFSAFGYETMFLMRRGDMVVAFSYIILSIFCGLAAIWLGIKLGHV